MMTPSIFGESLFDEFFDDFFDFPAFDDKAMQKAQKKLYGRHAANMMKTDVQEHDDHYEVDIDLPGFKKDEIGLELKDGYLIISAAKGLDQDEQDKKSKKYLSCMIISSSTTRSLETCFVFLSSRAIQRRSY